MLPITTSRKNKKHSKDFGGSLDDAICMKLAEVSRNTFYRYKKELKEQG